MQNESAHKLKIPIQNMTITPSTISRKLLLEKRDPNNQKVKETLWTIFTYNIKESRDDQGVLKIQDNHSQRSRI